jgi:YgiT-type zinc finger domain-containing protein
MKERDRVDSCPLCGGRKTPGTTTFTAELGFGVVVIRNVPATVCSQCGADWIADDTAGRIEALVDEARQKRLQVEVLSLA